MADSYDIYIDLSKEVKFPHRCPVCGREADAAFPFKANPDGYFGYHKWLLGMTEKYKIPCHNKCYRTIKNSTLYRNLILLGVATAIIFVAVYLDLSRWVALLSALVIASPIVIWQIRTPLPIEITKVGSKMNFTILNQTYAQDLAKTNDSKVE